MNAKKSILIYFDNYPMVVSLALEQRGLLLTVLMVYGERLSRENISLEEVMEQFPQLTPEARVICGFMGANIARDTQKWLNRQHLGSAVPSIRSRKGSPAPPTAEEKAVADRRAVEDMERARRILEHCQLLESSGCGASQG